MQTKGRKQGNKYEYYESMSWRQYSKENLKDKLKLISWSGCERMNAQQMADYMDQKLGTIKDELIVTRSMKKRINVANYPMHIIEKKTQT